MLFNSHLFIFLFLPVVLTGFFVLSCSSRTAARVWLLAASFVFYGWWSLSYLALFLVWTAVNFYLSQHILTLRHLRPRHAKAWTALAVTFNLALLGYYKYSAFIVDNVTALTGIDFALGAVILPLAISFHSFQQIAYLVDCLRDDVPRYTLYEYVQFVFFFPQLIAGPIVFHDELIPQLRSKKIFRFKNESFAQGVTFFVIGLAKKLCLADPISLLATPVFASADVTPPAFFEAWTAVAAFSLGLYFDFSAYSDMAIGLARMFNIRLPYNFDSPYKAASIIEFWRRWHITLSRSLRNYLYIPLGGNRKGTGRMYLNLGLTMLIGGLWHGAAWTFVAWGALHGIFLIINHACTAITATAASQGLELSLSKRSSHGLTLLAVAVAWVFFAAPGFSHAIGVLSGLSLINGLVQAGTGAVLLEILSGEDPRSLFGGFYKYLALAFGLFIVFRLPNSQEIVDDMANYVGRLRLPKFVLAPNAISGTVVAALFLFSLTFMAEVKEFIYFQF